MAKPRERIHNSVAHTMLPRIEKKQIFQFRTTFRRDARGKNNVHTRFLDCTRFHKSAAVLIGAKSAARKLTPWLASSIAMTDKTARESHWGKAFSSSVSLTSPTSRISASFFR